MKWALKNLLVLITMLTFIIICAYFSSPVISDNYFIIKKVTYVERTLSVSNVTKCSDMELVKHVKQKGKFYVLTNFVQAEKTFGCHESVTFAAPADYTFLDNLEPLVERWRGPISVSLYAPGFDFDTSRASINFIRECGSPLIKKYVTFHMFFDGEHLPKDTEFVSTNPDCTQEAPYNTSAESYKSLNNLTFPINVARNVAKEEAQTHFVLSADIELIPTPKFIEKFLHMVVKKPELFKLENKNVFVLPLFEVLESEKIPANKTKLQEMFKEKKAFIFHQKLCVICHKVPNGDKWMKSNESAFLDIFTVGKREGKYKDWEPFYVGTKDVPNFDERLSWEGQSNKMPQGYLMCVMDYNFLILNDAFLTHKPGIKKKKMQLQKFKHIVRETNALIRTVIVPEYNILYGTKKGCHLR